MIQKILQSRELRAKKQKEFLALYGKTLISITVNIPGSLKLSDDSIFIFEQMLDVLKQELKQDIKELFFKKQDTGIEGIYLSNKSSYELKKLTIKLESEYILGRFIDIDIIDKSGKILSRKDFTQEPRRCFICSKNAKVCARSQTHSIEELLEYISFCVKSFKFFEHISNLAKLSLVKEVELTPKPGLVDKKDNGSHKDMDINTFYASIEAINSYFMKFLSAGFLEENDLFEKLRKIGLNCEKDMFKATNGINTHKGIIFSFAVILGSIAAVQKQKKSLTKNSLQNQIKLLCKDLVKQDLEHKTKFLSAGERYFKDTKNAGIRSEAQNGYDTIFNLSLPFYEKNIKIFDEDRTLKLTLLLLISKLEDTALFNRGGLDGLIFAQNSAKKLLQKDTSNEDLKLLNEEFIKQNLSCGGSADMLALTWFLYEVFDI